MTTTSAFLVPPTLSMWVGRPAVPVIPVQGPGTAHGVATRPHHRRRGGDGCFGIRERLSDLLAICCEQHPERRLDDAVVRH